MEKRTLHLDGCWEFKEFPASARRMRDLEDGRWLPAQIPSSIYTDLIEAGCLRRFDLEANPEDFHWISERAWIYRRQFDLDAEFCRADTAELVFEGLDTVAQIWLNDKLLGKTENMFIPHRFELGDPLRCGTNTLLVKFLPAAAHAERLLKRYGPMSTHHYGDPRRSYVRKASYQFGSALGPPVPGCGIFRPVRLEAWNAARLENVHIRTIDCDEHCADVGVAVAVRRSGGHDMTPLRARLRITGGALTIDQTLDFEGGQGRNTTVIRIERPIFWQPNGHGVPHLYHLETQLLDGSGKLLDVQNNDFGVRRVRLRRDKEAGGRSFGFVVNDASVYIRGATWVPLSMFPGTHTDGDYERLLTRLKEAHVNMLRVWGGGYYEDDVFYRLCDRLGILVWQDFPFASAYYPDRQWFLDIVRDEADSVIKRLRNHPSVALWCGNSRADYLHQSGHLGQGRKFYGRGIYHSLLPERINELDPDREYLPTTPFSDSKDEDLNAPAEGTCHFRRVWDDFAPTREYLFEPSELPRFLCEFGLRSLPDRQCLERVCPPARLVCGSAAIEKHDYQADGSARLARYSAELFAPPASLDEQIAQSQVAQARAAKLCVEHLRACNERNGGVLIWTANDCAPAAGYSAIDASGQPKALYYYARRFFAPVLVTLEVDRDAYLRGRLTGSGVVVVNDRPLPLTATVRCRCMDFFGRTLDGVEFPAAVGPFATSPPRALPRALAGPHSPNRCFVQIEVITEAGTVAENRFFYLPDKYIDWPRAMVDMRITAQASSWTVVLRSPTLIRDAALCAPEAGIVSDKYCDIAPDTPTQVRVRFPGPAPSRHIALKLRSAPLGLI